MKILYHLPFAFNFYKFHEDRHYGKCYDCKYYQRKIFFYLWNIPKKVSQKGKSKHPRQSSCCVKIHKFPVTHFSNTSNKRRKRSDNWNETGQENSFSSVLFIKCLRFVNVFLVNKGNF